LARLDVHLFGRVKTSDNNRIKPEVVLLGDIILGAIGLGGKSLLSKTKYHGRAKQSRFRGRSWAWVGDF